MQLHRYLRIMGSRQPRMIPSIVVISFHAAVTVIARSYQWRAKIEFRGWGNYSASLPPPRPASISSPSFQPRQSSSLLSPIRRSLSGRHPRRPNTASLRNWVRPSDSKPPRISSPGISLDSHIIQKIETAISNHNSSYSNIHPKTLIYKHGSMPEHANAEVQ